MPLIEVEYPVIDPEAIEILERFVPGISDQLYYDPREVKQLAVSQLVRFDYRCHTHAVEARPDAI